MQASLFDISPAGEQIQLEDASLLYFPNFYPKTRADELFHVLQEQVPWRQDHIQIAGLARLQPRLSAWFGDSGAEYTYSGLHLVPLPWHPCIRDIKQEIEQVIASSVVADMPSTSFNSVLLNNYRDQYDSMGWHSDDEPELGPQPVIASLSLGGTREFALKHKYRKGRHFKIPLAHGSLLVMFGNTQSHWQHAIAKETMHCDARINLTFRRIYPSEMI